MGGRFNYIIWKSLSLISTDGRSGDNHSRLRKYRACREARHAAVRSATSPGLAGFELDSGALLTIIAEFESLFELKRH